MICKTCEVMDVSQGGGWRESDWWRKTKVVIYRNNSILLREDGVINEVKKVSELNAGV